VHGNESSGSIKKVDYQLFKKYPAPWIKYGWIPRECESSQEVLNQVHLNREQKRRSVNWGVQIL
jgi:hypothetical protein